MERRPVIFFWKSTLSNKSSPMCAVVLFAYSFLASGVFIFPGQDDTFEKKVKQAVAKSKVLADKDGVEIPTTVEEYCLNSKVSIDDDMDDTMDDDLDDDVEFMTDDDDDDFDDSDGGSDDDDNDNDDNTDDNNTVDSGNER